MDGTNIQVRWLFFCFRFQSIRQFGLYVRMIRIQDLFKYDSNGLYIMFQENKNRTNVIQNQYNVYSNTHIHTNKLQQPRNFNKLTLFCRDDGLIGFAYDRFIFDKLPAWKPRNWYLLRQCSFIECVICLEVVCENSQVKCQLCMWHIIFIP